MFEVCTTKWALLRPISARKELLNDYDRRIDSLVIKNIKHLVLEVAAMGQSTKMFNSQ